MNNTNKMIDIIIPVYNTPSDLLERCLTSAIRQTYRDVKVIVIDDGSTAKNTIAVLEKYCKIGSLELYVQQNNGVSTARNLGLSKSRGDYVLFLDSDDYIDEDYLERIASIAISKNKDLVFSGRVNDINKKNDAPFYNHQISLVDDSRVIAFKSHAFTCSAVLIKGELARSIEFTATTTMGEDTEYIIKALSLGNGFFEGGGGNYYVQNLESITHNNSISSIERYLDESVKLGDCLSNYLRLTDDEVTMFLYLKCARAHQKLAQDMHFRKVRKVLKNHIIKYGLPRLSFFKIVKTPHLAKGEKIRIYLFGCRNYLIIYLLDKTRALIKRRS